jgi:hypothetical protein
VLPGDPDFEDVVARHPKHPSTRAVVTVDVERVSGSCGYGVPVMDVVGERDLLRLGAEKRGPTGLSAYRAEKNAISIDGLPGLDPSACRFPCRTGRARGTAGCSLDVPHRALERAA